MVSHRLLIFTQLEVRQVSIKPFWGSFHITRRDSSGENKQVGTEVVPLHLLLKFVLGVEDCC